MEEEEEEEEDDDEQEEEVEEKEEEGDDDNEDLVSESDNDNTGEKAGKNWENFSNGFASKMLHKMGYKGKGLGKYENGINEPIKIVKKKRFDKEFESKSHKEKRNAVYILSDSMLNQIDEKLLSKSKVVKVKSHGGCTTKCMYKHLPEVIKLKPKYIVLHIGTNDCMLKTSDEVLRDIAKLKKYIENASPTSTVIISTPITRTDNTTANQIVQNINIKLRNMNYRLMDNSNIKSYHLGRKGLHLSNHGTKKLAINLISLIKRL